MVMSKLFISKKALYIFAQNYVNFDNFHKNDLKNNI